MACHETSAASNDGRAREGEAAGSGSEKEGGGRRKGGRETAASGEEKGGGGVGDGNDRVLVPLQDEHGAFVRGQGAAGNDAPRVPKLHRAVLHRGVVGGAHREWGRHARVVSVFAAGSGGTGGRGRGHRRGRKGKGRPCTRLSVQGSGFRVEGQGGTMEPV
jgi:hypothetical protein